MSKQQPPPGAKKAVTITLYDLPNGNISFIADPSIETLIMKLKSGQSLTSAEGYAINLANGIRSISKIEGMKKKLVIGLPLVRRPH